MTNQQGVSGKELTRDSGHRWAGGWGRSGEWEWREIGLLQDKMAGCGSKVNKRRHLLDKEIITL